MIKNCIIVSDFFFLCTIVACMCDAGSAARLFMFTNRINNIVPILRHIYFIHVIYLAIGTIPTQGPLTSFIWSFQP